MRRFTATIALAGAASLMLATGTPADPIAGPTAFEYSATCTGIGSVMLTNAGPSHGVLLVVGTSASVLVPEAATPSPALLQQALAAEQHARSRPGARRATSSRLTTPSRFRW